MGGFATTRGVSYNGVHRGFFLKTFHRFRPKKQVGVPPPPIWDSVSVWEILDLPLVLHMEMKVGSCYLVHSNDRSSFPDRSKCIHVGIYSRICLDWRMVQKNMDRVHFQNQTGDQLDLLLSLYWDIFHWRWKTEDDSYDDDKCVQT